MIVSYFHQEIKKSRDLEKSLLVRLLLCACGLLFSTWIFIFIQLGKPVLLFTNLYYWAGLTLTTPILYIAILPVYRALRKMNSVRFTLDFPLMFTLLLTYLYSLYNTVNYTDQCFAFFDSILMILFILNASRYLEAFCQHYINKHIQSLTKLPSPSVKILQGENTWIDAELNDIEMGDKLRITPGQYFPVDGVICEGETSVDESMLTGEAHSIAKFTREKVRAGTCNLDKTIIIEATSLFESSDFGKTLASIEKMQNIKKEQTPGNHIALWYQMITLITFGAIFCWWLPLGISSAIFCSISALLVVCPCAIAINYPLTVASLIEVCAKKGILVKNPLALYHFKEASQVIFDKTGTLTEGNLVVEKIEYCNHYTSKDVLPLIATIERHTRHPVAHAIVEFAKIKQCEYLNIDIHRLRVFPSKGVRAKVGGKFILIGTAEWLKKNGVFIPPEIIKEENNLNADTIFIHCSIGGIEVARIQLQDKIREDAMLLIQFLTAQNMNTSLLSGDKPAIVNAIAKQLGPIAATAQALPRHKESQVSFLQDQGHITAMVGDGLNDAMALKRADIGIALATGNPISLLCADIILQKPKLQLIKDCYLLSATVRSIVKQNFLISLVFSGVLLPFAAVGKITPTICLITFSLNSLLIMGNVTRLKFMHSGYFVPRKARSPLNQFSLT